MRSSRNLSLLGDLNVVRKGRVLNTEKAFVHIVKLGFMAFKTSTALKMEARSGLGR